MKKVNKALEALYNFDHWIQVEFAEQFKIIEKALKRLEEKDHNCEVYLKQMNGLASKLAKNEKELKALEIIRNCFDLDVEIGSLPDGTLTYKLNVWCKGTPVVVKPISKDKYDLLKEVFNGYEKEN